MNYLKYDDINYKKFEILQAPSEVVEEYRNWEHEVGDRTNQNFTKREMEFLGKFYYWLGRSCADPMNRKSDTVRTRAHRNKIKTHPEILRLNRLNSYSYSNFCKNPNKFTAYILGFMWADGTVGTKELKEKLGNTTTLKIANEDYLKVKGFFDVEADFNYRIDKDETYKDKAVVKISDRIFSDFLHKMDFHKKSSGIGPVKIMDFLGSELENHFVRGFFDGDGSFIWGAGCDKKVAFTSDKNQDWSFMESVCNNLKIDSWVSRTDSSSSFMITNFSGIKSLFDYMYEGDDECSLPRKKNRFEDYFQAKANARPNKSSKYRGVTRHKGRWLMQAYDKSIKRSVRKFFDSELDAAREYDKLAKQLFKNKAILNFND